MKKEWNSPELTELKVSATKEGVEPTEDHDFTTYDANGKWWGGSKENS